MALLNCFRELMNFATSTLPHAYRDIIEHISLSKFFTPLVRDAWLNLLQWLESHRTDICKEHLLHLLGFTSGSMVSSRDCSKNLIAAWSYRTVELWIGYVFYPTHPVPPKILPEPDPIVGYKKCNRPEPVSFFTKIRPDPSRPKTFLFEIEVSGFCSKR